MTALNALVRPMRYKTTVIGNEAIKYLDESRGNKIIPLTVSKEYRINRVEISWIFRRFLIESGTKKGFVIDHRSFSSQKEKRIQKESVEFLFCMMNSRKISVEWYGKYSIAR